MNTIKSSRNFMLLAFCLISIISFAQRTPDPNNTFGEGTTTSSSTYTNPDTFIPETKTDYQDANGVTRKETIKTKDYEGNNVTKEKTYDKSGRLIKESETRTDGKGRMVYSDEKEYGWDGRVIRASKFSRADGKFYFFDYDYTKQQYNDPRIVSSITNDSKEVFACNKPKFRLAIGYSYLATGKGKNKINFPVGVDLGLGLRLNKNFRFVFNTSGHSRNNPGQSLMRIHGLAGVEFNRENCDKQPPISIFSRIAIGMMHERLRNAGTKSQGTNAAIGAAGAGIDINVSQRMAVRLSGDYILAFVQGATLNNYRVGAGLNIGIGNK